MSDYVLNFNNVRVVPSVALVRFCTGQAGDTIITNSFWGDADHTSSARYTYDPTDTTTADDGWSCLVGVNNQRWKICIVGGVNVRQAGAKGDGLQVDGPYIQSAINYAAQMFNQVAFPPAGGYFNPPVVLLPPGAYRLQATLNLYLGMTLTGISDMPMTVEHTRLIMDTASGTTNLSIPIINVTATFNGTARAPNVTTTIANLGFWFINPGASMTSRTGTAFTVGTNGIGNQGTGSAIYIAESCVDTRVLRCNFYSMPNSAIWLNQSSNSISSDIEVSGCEFDTSVMGVRFSGGNLRARLWGNTFYGNSRSYYFDGTQTGSVDINGGYFESGASGIEVTSTTLTRFSCKNVVHEGMGANGSFLKIAGAGRVSIINNEVGLTVASTIQLTNVPAGMVAHNLLIDCGYNASTDGLTTNTTDPAGILAYNCQIVIRNNDLEVPDSATYNCFGIRTENGTGASSCIIDGNRVKPVYNGATYRSQNRRINTSTGDTVGTNWQI